MSGPTPANREKYRETVDFSPEKRVAPAVNAALIDSSCIFRTPKLTGNAFCHNRENVRITGKHSQNNKEATEGFFALAVRGFLVSTRFSTPATNQSGSCGCESAA